MKWTYFVLNFKAHYIKCSSPRQYMDPSELMEVCSLVVSLKFFITHPARNRPESEQEHVNTKIRAALQHSSLIWEISMGKYQGQ